MGILEFILVIIVLMWLGGWGFHIGGDDIHFLLVLAFIVLLYRIYQGRRL